MTALLTAAQMRSIEQTAIDGKEVSGLDLMERAGQGVIEAIFDEWPELAKTTHSAVVLCGPGNNGGDGFVVARLLHKWGSNIEAYLFGDPDKLPPDAKINHDRWALLGKVHTFGNDMFGAKPKPDLLVDAIFGTGLARPIDGELADVLGALESVSTDHGAKTVAIDLPSGICSDSGKPLGAATIANLTVSFHTEKAGHRLGRAEEYCGKVVVKDIGLTDSSPSARPADFVRLVEAPRSLTVKTQSGHKYTHGHALVLSGGPGHTGAARLAARGALRIGAGLVTLGVPPSAQMEVASQITAVMLKRVRDADALSDILEDPRFNALCLGPALGMDEHAQSLVRAALKANRPTVLDADALSILQIDEADGIMKELHEKCVLTPHAGEFARLFPDIAKKLNVRSTTGPAYSKVDATRAAAKRAGCVVLFKGADTVIASPDGQCALHSAHYERTAPWLATAGSGDVLAGFIAGLLARGETPQKAAEMAAYLHVECALNFGHGLISEDIAEQLPDIFRKLSR